MESGKKTVNAAVKEIKETKAAAKVAKAEAETPKPTERTGDLKKIEAVMGETFARAVEIGTVLKTPREMKAFMALKPADQKGIVEMVLKGWTVGHSVKFLRRAVDENTRIHDLIHRCIQAKGPFVVIIGGYTITTAFTGK